MSDVAKRKIAPSGAITIQHDGELAIAVGSNRMTKVWKNKNMSWSTLVNRLSETRRTGESIAEYKRMPKSQQDQVKDVGGFVGGALAGGRRLADTVKWRQLLTLDADHPSDSPLWDDFTMIVGAAGVVYSTHKHQPDSPRLRLIIPLSRPVDPDEYQAIGRKVASWLGIDQFDDTTYQPHRLMYWPSTSSDGVYEFQYIDAPWLDPDGVLNTYDDWTDVTFWPESSRRAVEIKRLAKQQGDPYEKKGTIGAFCRTYSIAETIERFLSGVYEPAGEDRYTFMGGSTAAGAIVYDDKFLYSHHGTDPVGGKLVNAFDLVRIHRFAEMDEDVSPDTPVNKIPSFLAMQDLAAGDKEVKLTILEERRASARDDFDFLDGTETERDWNEPDNLERKSENVPNSTQKEGVSEGHTDENVPDSEEDGTDDWREKLELTRSGKVVESIGNAILILERDPALRSAFGLNEFTGRVNVRRNLPWRKREEGLLWTDIDDADLRHFMESVYDHTHKGNIEAAFASVTRKSRFHPVREYLNKLEWDGTARIGSLLVEYLGAENNEYVREVTRKTLIAAIARIFEPGCKFDYMLTLVGPQGVGKSTLFNLLAGEWFSDSFHTFQGKEAYEQLQGAWIVEIAELAATKKADVESMKQFITKRVDSYRQAYGRHISEFKRQSIFIGTTNDYEFLRDRTGNRRFWVVEVGVEEPMFSMWDELAGSEVDQIWAEALYYYKLGEELRLPTELEKEALANQELHVEEAPLKGLIEEYLDIPITDDWYSKPMVDRKNYIQRYRGPVELTEIGEEKRMQVCAMEIWVELLGKDRGDLKRGDLNEIKNTLSSISGWGRPKTASGKVRFGTDYGIQTAYIRHT